MILIGGTDGTNSLKDVWRSMNNGLTWSVATSSPIFDVRNSFGAVAFGSTIFIIGGISGASYKDGIFQSSDLGNTWILVTQLFSTFAPRSGHTLVLAGNSLSVSLIGGSTGTSTAVNDVWASYYLACTGTAFSISSSGVCQCASIYSGNPFNNNGILDGCFIVPSLDCVGPPYLWNAAVTTCVCSVGYSGAVTYRNNVIGGCNICPAGKYSSTTSNNMICANCPGIKVVYCGKYFFY